MSPTETQKDATFSLNQRSPSNGAVDSLSTVPGRRRGADARSRERSAPVLVVATVHWWRADERRGSSSTNQFGLMPTTPIRFRCIGSITPKYPKRYRIDLAQVLDWLPELTRRELKDLGASLAEAVAIKLGVEVAPLSCDVMDLDLTNAGEPQ
ncbi:MAG: hypothetical protein BZY81_06935 [SAR202 cluster bacterium Io17-Chloro-G4]|nr:MAG: hypothetical protein BZY81_06935 [SAR202 cluster bacterium Io17-Chloro-G4]